MLPNWNVSCPWCGRFSRETIAAATEDDARKTYIEQHRKNARALVAGCRTDESELVVEASND